MLIPLETFINLYNNITKDDYDFLFYDVKNKKFRKNFDEQIIF